MKWYDWIVLLGTSGLILFGALMAAKYGGSFPPMPMRMIP